MRDEYGRRTEEYWFLDLEEARKHQARLQANEWLRKHAHVPIPDWSKAPSWAYYWLCDKSGKFCWRQYQPDHAWNNGTWSNALMPGPQPSEEAGVTFDDVGDFWYALAVHRPFDLTKQGDLVKWDCFDYDGDEEIT